MLNPIINQNDEDDEEEDDDGIGCTGVTISVCEERYPQQWQWLHQFRLKLEEVQKKATLLSASSSSSSNKSDAAITETSVNETNNFVIVRRKIEILDDILLAFSDDDSSSDEEQNQECSLKASSATATFESQTVIVPEQSEGDYAAAAASSEQSTLSVLAKSTSSPLNDIDRETRQLQLVLLAMPPSESASTEVVRHTVNKIVSLLSRYVELDGTTGIKRCGDILGRCYTYATDSTDPTIIDKDDNKSSHRGSISNMNRFPLTEAMSSSLVSAYLTDATGALRVKTFLHSFILPLMMELNPSIRSTNSGGLDVIKANNDLGKPASRVLISLLSSLARERPMECVASILVPSLVMTTTKYTLFEPNRFQCELISRVLRGKDALNSQAIAFLVSELLPTKEELNTLTISYSSSLIGGMKWTENTMPILTACLIGQLTLSDDAVMTLSGMISYQLSSNVKSSSTLMAKSIKFSTLFQTFVAKYGSQVKSIHKVESLLDSATRLKTFMSKTICLSLKKLM